ADRGRKRTPLHQRPGAGQGGHPPRPQPRDQVRPPHPPPPPRPPPDHRPPAPAGGPPPPAPRPPPPPPPRPPPPPPPHPPPPPPLARPRQPEEPPRPHQRPDGPAGGRDRGQREPGHQQAGDQRVMVPTGYRVHRHQRRHHPQPERTGLRHTAPAGQSGQPDDHQPHPDHRHQPEPRQGHQQGGPLTGGDQPGDGHRGRGDDQPHRAVRGGGVLPQRRHLRQPRAPPAGRAGGVRVVPVQPH